MLLKKGSSGLQVQAVQAFLKIRITGLYGTQTVAAVREYQKSMGLVADGIVGPNTRNSMFGTPITKIKETFKTLTTRNLRSDYRIKKITGVGTDHLVNILISQFENNNRIRKTLKKGIDHLKIHGYRYNITTVVDLAYIMGQIKQEVGYRFHVTENLNYNPKSLIATFSYYQDRPKEAYQDGYVGYRKANILNIANKAYANRYLNGDTNSGDGWRFRGMGAIQTTFRYNVRQLDYWVKKLGLPVEPKFEEFPKRRCALEYVMMTAFIYWKQTGCYNEIGKNGLIRQKSVDSISRIVNRYTKSLPQRRKYTKTFAKLLGVRYA